MQRLFGSTRASPSLVRGDRIPDGLRENDSPFPIGDGGDYCRLTSRKQLEFALPPTRCWAGKRNGTDGAHASTLRGRA